MHMDISVRVRIRVGVIAARLRQSLHEQVRVTVRVHMM
jgi:hypothetical protein